MREILLENAYWFGDEWKALADEYEAIPKKDKQARTDFINNELKKGITKHIKIKNSKTIEILLKSIAKKGTNTRRNSCLIYLAGILENKMPYLKEKYANHLNYILNLLYEGKLNQDGVNKKFIYSDKRQKFLYNPGLYDRPLDEFKWAIETIPEYTGKKYQVEVGSIKKNPTATVSEAVLNETDSDEVSNNEPSNNSKETKVVATTPPFFDKNGILKPHSELQQIIKEWDEKLVDVEDEDIAPDQLEHKITDKLIDRYDDITTSDDRLAFLKRNIFPMEMFQNLSGIKDILAEDFLISTIDPKRNVFLAFCLKLPFPVTDTQKYREKFRYVYESYKLKKIRLDLEVLSNPSLYERSIKDFRYTVNAFNMCSNPKTVANYLKDTSKVNINDFMSGNNVKSAQEIYDIIEDWANDNEYSAQEIEDRNNQRKETPQSRVPDEKTLEKLVGKFKNSNLEDIEKAFKKEDELEKGTLIFSPKNKADEQDNTNAGFYTWNGEKWEEYDTTKAKNVLNKYKQGNVV